MSQVDLTRLRSLSTTTLEKLVTDEGIYASSSMGNQGMYHGFFGRDTAITAYLIAETEYRNQDTLFYLKAINGLIRLMSWQSTKDDPDTGEETGKFPHEIRLDEADYKHLTTDFISKGMKSWYVDPIDNTLKNWDTNDATQLWIIVISRLIDKELISMNSDLQSSLRRGLLWCLRNIHEFDGFAGYKYNPQRRWAGLINQTWKDSEAPYQYADGKVAELPIKDVFVNALTWCALKYGAKIFKSDDHRFASLLDTEAATLKSLFNDSEKGFLMRDTKSNFYYSEALDKNGKQLTGVCADAAMALWAYCDDESIIDASYIRSVVKRIMSSDMFDPDAGIRTYSCEGNAYDPIPYHRGPHNFWPFVSALIADGLNHFGYGYETRQILTAMVRGIQKFDSCVELFVKNENRYERFKHPIEGQISCSEQAWTAAAVYFATGYLQIEESVIETIEND